MNCGREMIRVYISVTSIPSRINRLLESCIEGLIAQDYQGICGIIVTVPRVNMRGQVFSDSENKALASFMKREAFIRKNVVFHRPGSDAGPMMKFLGAYPFIKADARVREEETCVFVCDDDQIYPPSFISSYVSILNQLSLERRKKTVVGCTGNGFLGKIHPSFRSVMGLRGILLPSNAIRKLHKKVKPLNVPRCCAMNDDTFISLMLYKLGYLFVRASSCSMDVDNEEGDGLCKSYGGFEKPKEQIQCHAKYNTGIVTALIFGVFLILAVSVTLPVLLVLKYKKMN